jgi:hypothetical protein
MDNKYKLKSTVSELYAMMYSDKGINTLFKYVINSVNNWINFEDTPHDDDYRKLREIYTELNWIDNNRTKSNTIRKPLIKKLYNKFQTDSSV